MSKLKDTEWRVASNLCAHLPLFKKPDMKPRNQISQPAGQGGEVGQELVLSNHYSNSLLAPNADVFHSNLSFSRGCCEECIDKSSFPNYQCGRTCVGVGEGKVSLKI